MILDFNVCLKALALGVCVFHQAYALGASPVKQAGSVWGRENKQLQAPLLQARQVDEYPEQIREEVGGQSITVYGIDLDTDGKQDYIVYYESIYKTCYVKSDLSKKWCHKLGFGDGFAYYYFVQLDSTPMLELFSLVGDSEWDEYALYRFDEDTWAINKVMMVVPFLNATDIPIHTGIYWGYPWDIQGLDIKYQDGKILIPVSIDVSELDELGKYRCLYPMFFFKGLPTQGGNKGRFGYLQDNIRYITFDKLISEIKSKLEYKLYIERCTEPEI